MVRCKNCNTRVALTADNACPACRYDYDLDSIPENRPDQPEVKYRPPIRDTVSGIAALMANPRTVVVGFALCTVILFVAAFDGGMVVRPPLIAGVGFGIAISLLGDNKKETTPIVIISAALMGAVFGTLIGLCSLDLDVERLNNPDPQTKVQYDVEFLVWWEIIGALSGAILGAVGCWLATNCSSGDTSGERRE